MKLNDDLFFPDDVGMMAYEVKYSYDDGKNSLPQIKKFDNLNDAKKFLEDIRGNGIQSFLYIRLCI